MRPQAGYIGFLRTPTSTTASGVWTLREAETFTRSGTWPGAGGASITKLLMHFDQITSTFADSSPYARTVTFSGSTPSISTEVKKFGASMVCGSNYATVPSSSDFDWSTGDAVIEGWIYPTAVDANRVICSTSSTTDDGATAVYVSPYGQLCIDKIGVSGVASSEVVTADEWFHFACVKTGSSTYIYVNGTKVGTGTASNAWSSGSAPFSVGKSYWSSGSNFLGYIDDLRVTVGSDRGYTGSTITVPTEAYPDS